MVAKMKKFYFPNHIDIKTLTLNLKQGYVCNFFYQ